MPSKSICFVLPVALFLTGCGSDVVEPEPVPVQVTSFSFLDGLWGVTSTYVLSDGSSDVQSAQAVIRNSIGDRVRKEQWLGVRNGRTAEVATMFVASDNAGQWIVARADGDAGTFDVLEGVFSNGTGTFTSRPGTRPDGGLTRETFSNIQEDSFSWRAERSEDDGQSWQVYWTMEYGRGTNAVPTSPGVANGCTSTSYREFDFWEGNWAIGAATNDLRGLLGGCVLEENWVGSENGTSYNMYDVRSDLWTQVWRDDNDFTLVIFGGIDGNRMVMTGPRLGSLQRISWTPNPDGTVRQHGEASSDNGQSWTTSYDLTYVKR